MRKWLPLVAVCLGWFMLPEMAQGLRASLASLQWVVNIYTLILAVSALSAGSVSDLFGRRRVFAGSLVLFSLASLACGARSSAPPRRRGRSSVACSPSI